MNARVFISYASEDFDAATRLRDALEHSGIPCWMAPRDIEPGTSFPAAIRSAISVCGAQVLLLTESSNGSPHVLSEIELAFNERKPILPVIVGRVVPAPNLRYFISTTHWFDAEGDFDQQDIDRIRVHLQKLLAGEPLDADHPTDRRWWPWWAAAAAAVLAVLSSLVYFSQGEPPPDRTPIEKPVVEQPPVVEKPPVAPKPEPPAPEPRLRTRVNTRDGQTYVWIPPGTFSMGCSPGDSECEDDERPTQLVRVKNGFWLARTEVTNAQYAARTGPVQASGGNAEPGAPVTGITWQEAKDYCAAIGGRLPTEAEWEYAARAGSTTSRYDVTGSIAWYEANSDERTHAAAGKEPNAFGLHDMLGNDYEWVLDRYYNKYYEPTDDAIEEPTFPNASATARGGAWTSSAGDVRASNRLALPNDAAEPNVGFRCALRD
jgi:hypothetical protein